MAPWVPLLEGDRRDRATAAIDRIAVTLVARPLADDVSGFGLMRGEMGVALFLAYYARARGDDRAAARAGEIVDRGLELVASTRTDESRLYAGFTGTAWTVEHLRAMFEVEPDVDDAVDATLFELLDAQPEWFCFEWLAGVSGWAVYALERRPWGGALLQRVVDELAHHAERGPRGVRWRCPPWMPIATTDRFPDGCYLLDPAHGAMGPIGALAAAAKLGAQGARELVAASVDAIMAQRFSGDHGPMFKQYANDEEGGLAWCRGDGGAAGVLSMAGDLLDEAAWSDVGVAAARRVAISLGLIRALDPGGLCHGLAGTAHILHRVARRSGDTELLVAARAGFERVTNALAHRDEEDASLLTGNAGIALALLGATTDIEPEWDRALLLSARSGSPDVS